VVTTTQTHDPISGSRTSQIVFKDSKVHFEWCLWLKCNAVYIITRYCIYFCRSLRILLNLVCMSLIGAGLQEQASEDRRRCDEEPLVDRLGQLQTVRVARSPAFDRLPRRGHLRHRQLRWHGGGAGGPGK
jgi:hypothetical protein